jgi:membrane-associated phospholipid phosphatase
VPLITSTDGTDRVLRAWTLKVFGVYVALAACVNLWRLASGTGSVVLLIAQLVVLAATVFSLRSRTHFWSVTGDWLPLIVLPMLYWELPWASVGGGRLFDSMVQRWDMVLFGTEPARTWAGSIPSRPLSELLHLAYILYYAIIYVPPAVLYTAGRHPERSEGKRPFYATVFALTVTVVVSFAAFSVFPVEGPRFAWGAPPGVPPGPIRTFTLLILEHGSARGTAFPSSHVAIALAQTLSSLRWRRSLGVWVAITTALLAIGAVYGGFHYGADVLAGGVVGGGVWAVAQAIEPAQPGGA